MLWPSKEHLGIQELKKRRLDSSIVTVEPVVHLVNPPGRDVQQHEVDANDLGTKGAA